MANISAWWRITVCVWTHTYTETWWKLMELPVLKGSSLVMQTRYVISTKIQAIVLWAKPYYSSPTALIYRTLTHLTQNECARERKRAEEYWIAVVLLRALLWLNIIRLSLSLQCMAAVPLTARSGGTTHVFHRTYISASAWTPARCSDPLIVTFSQTNVVWN